MKNSTSRQASSETTPGQVCPAETSVVLRYLDDYAAMLQGDNNDDLLTMLRNTSIREGARVFPLLIHNDVDIHILDETSLMHTGTFKSIDGCVTTARCKLRGDTQVVFESGGNNGTALAAYCQRAGIETFCFAPVKNLSLLDSRIFGHDKTHLIAVTDSGQVKDAARHFAQTRGLHFIPEPGWRLDASMFRGFFILEILESQRFDWLTQAISAAFGPIGIYHVLQNCGRGSASLPRFLGVQQEANCPMFTTWNTQEKGAELNTDLDEELLSRVMYDVKPQTHNTYADLENILASSSGELTTVNAQEFNAFMERRFSGRTILDLLEENELCITRCNGDIREKTGLMALAGLFKEIDAEHILPGSRVLCSLSGGASKADGKAQADYQVSSLADVDKLFHNIYKPLNVSNP